MIDARQLINAESSMDATGLLASVRNLRLTFSGSDR